MTAMPRAETIEELTKVTKTERPQSLPRVVILGAGFGGNALIKFKGRRNDLCIAPPQECLRQPRLQGGALRRFGKEQVAQAVRQLAFVVRSHRDNKKD